MVGNAGRYWQKHILYNQRDVYKRQVHRQPGKYAIDYHNQTGFWKWLSYRVFISSWYCSKWRIFKLVEVFSAADNIVAGTKGKLKSKGAVRDEIKKISEQLGLEVDPDKQVYNLSLIHI